MKIKKTKNIIVILSVIIFTSVCGLLGCTSQIGQGHGSKTAMTEYSSEQYKFCAELILDKNTARLDETIKALVTFKNLSDKYVYIELPDWVCSGLDYENARFEDAISFWVTKNIKAAYISIAIFPRCGIILEKDAVITCVKEYKSVERGKNTAYIDIMFYAGKESCDCENLLESLWIEQSENAHHECMESVRMQSEKINITIW